MIVSADQLRGGDRVIDSLNRCQWFVKGICDGFIVLKDMDPPIETDTSPVYFHTTWRIRSTSNVKFLLIDTGEEHEV